MDGSAALQLVREIGIARLAGFDGCVCSSCEVQGVSISIGCRKSTAGIEKIAPDFCGINIRVYSHHDDKTGEALVAIAREVAKQLTGQGYAIMARFTDYERDAKQLCTYCAKPRSDPQGYLCEKCLTARDVWGSKIADEFDFRKFDFTIPTAVAEVA